MRMSRSHTIVSLLVLIQSDKNCNRKICLWSIPKNFALWLVNKVSLLFGLCRFTSLSSLLMHFSTICTLTYGKAHKRSWASMDVKGNCTTVHYFQKNIVRTSHQITTYPSRPLSARLPKSPIPIKISPIFPSSSIFERLTFTPADLLDHENLLQSLVSQFCIEFLLQKCELSSRNLRSVCLPYSPCHTRRPSW